MISITESPVLSQVTNSLEPHNAYLVSPRGNRTSVNISPEAAIVWAKYGFRVEWIAATGKRVA
jgi:anthranilate phosphoribosyltransferase